MEAKRFDANFDDQAKLITHLVIFGALIAYASEIFNVTTSRDSSASLVFLLFPVTLIVWAIHPVYYAISDGSINIKRPLGQIKISFEAIDEVRLIEPGDLGLLVRLFGSGGLFGYLGVYSSYKIGKLMMWCTNKEGFILIICGDKKTVISPADPSGFLAEYFLRSHQR
jgi:PH (Pleckstrin Homology) domain-containing protein